VRAVRVEAHAAGARHAEAVLGQALGLGDERDHVLAKAIHSAIEPEAHDLLDLVTHGGVVHVEVWLTLGKDVQVVLLENLVVLPCVALEQAVPVVGRVHAAVQPHAPLAPEVVVVIPAERVLPALLKPRVLGRCVVDHEIHDHPEAAGVRLRDDLVKHLERTVLGVDVAVVGDVVAVVRVWRGVERREPDARHAEALDVVELAEHAPEVADAVTVTVAEAPRPDLVEHHVLVPAVPLHGHSRHRVRQSSP